MLWNYCKLNIFFNCQSEYSCLNISIANCPIYSAVCSDIDTKYKTITLASLHLEQFNTNLGLIKSVKHYSSSSLWNSIHDDFVQLKTTNSFKRKYKDFLLHAVFSLILNDIIKCWYIYHSINNYDNKPGLLVVVVAARRELEVHGLSRW